MKKGALDCMLAAATLVAMAGAQAQALSDPTRPPSVPSGSSAVPEEAAGMQLQSILLSSGRKIAVIDGNMVGVGGMVGEAKVVRISATEVALRKGDETEILKLFPGIEKRPSKRRSVRPGSGGSGPASDRQGGSK